MDIKIDEVEMKNLSSNIHRQAESIRKLCQSLNSVTTSLTPYWKGETFVQFSSKVIGDSDSYQANLTKFSKELDDIATYMEQSIALYEKMDSTYHSKKIDL